MNLESEAAEENWEELLGIYTGVLQDEACSELPIECNPTSLIGLNQKDPFAPDFSPSGIAGLTCGEDHVQSVAFVGSYNRPLPQISSPTHLVGVNHRGHNTEDIKKCRSFNQSARNLGSIVQNESDAVNPREVYSLAESIGMKHTLSASNVNADRSTCAYGSDGMVHLQNPILHTNQGIGGYNLQQIPTSRLSVAYRPSYNLNLPPTTGKGELTEAAGPLQLGPVTTDQQKLQKNKILQVPNLSVDEVLTNENSKQDNAVSPPQAEIGEREPNSFLFDSLGASSAAISTMEKEKEKENSGGDDGEIDLNKTPPQKTPKRRKHRPKVVVEGKTKRAPKPKATENNTTGGNSTTKRKYVRKKGIKTATGQSIDATNGVEEPNVKSKEKSCKRTLNFNEIGLGKKNKGREFDQQADNIEGSRLNLNVDFHSAELKGQSTSTVENIHQNIFREEKQTKNPYNFIQSVDEITPNEFIVPPTPQKDHTLNVLARMLNVRNANTNQSGRQGMNRKVDHHIGGGLAQILAYTSKQNLNGNGQPNLLNRPQFLEDFVNVGEKQESKIEHSYTDMARPPTVAQKWSYGVSGMGHCSRESRQFLQNCLDGGRTTNVEDQNYGHKSSLPSGNRTAEYCSEQIQSTGNKSFHAESTKMHLNGRSPYCGEGKSTFIDLTNETNELARQWCMKSTDPRDKFHKQVNSYVEQMAHSDSHFAKAQTTSSLTAVANQHIEFASQRNPQATKVNDNTDSPAGLYVKKRAARQIPSNMISKNLLGSGHDPKKVTGSPGYKRNQFSIDDITDHMKNLHIDNNGIGAVQEDQNALVPYRGDGAVVPFEVFDPIKKRRPRPKVDLDPETNRLWNLLMGNEGSESAKTMDNDKQKFWEDERNVFRGRVDSFIARMHLVQGDRRFSKWKGSVVDSVIGVFLTQNVSDHLSSSAFMSLAAKFPLKPTTAGKRFCQNRGDLSNEQNVIVIYPDERTFCRHPLTRQPVINRNSVTSSQLSQYKAENVTSGKSFFMNNTRRNEDCIISSQSSSESVCCQASEDFRSSSGSNSEVEDHITGSRFRKTLCPLNLYEQTERIAAFQKYEVQDMGSSFAEKMPSNKAQQSENLVQNQNSGVATGRNACSYPLIGNVLHYQRPMPPSTNFWQKMLMGIEESEIDLLECMGKQCSSSLDSKYFDATYGPGVEHVHDKARQSAESSYTDQQTRSSKVLNHEVINKHPGQKMNFLTEPCSRNSQYFINYSQRGMQETSQQQSSSPTYPVKSAESFRRKKDNHNPSENVTVEPTKTKMSHVSDVQSSKVSTTSNARKRKADKEKVEPCNWDTLREHVESKVGTKGRSSNTLDSLDYEALRNADVHEISKTIKERGMNNMLAERMKDFLNRLVKDHARIDLEWLRDVQPDKAKDYLLSIRGLGLKSVECVRLLTLHHLAFPVDTNVGRIAVRLGWVPLQPLPETLQLHLLELYPVLESIQKYLWPRLCMLDQETLYELHYQLITFGKVFCTKRQPNCNACPMRGECRHFASAFASARLALPGPEERRVIFSDVPSSSIKSCGVVIKPMLLPPAEDELGRGPEITRNCEPIIEEPSTPESSIEVSERDIEDAFYEDPEEIPEIKLNIEEFTSNLQSFIQEKMEMQEGDMSKALVALSPKFASIPTPKLKQVSRLRTEHQVYELPDSHPLLKGLDRREPDDPSPYLLAIWAPGETADSVEPPGNRCSSSKGGPCNTKTCFSCNSTSEAETQTVRGTILIPCRTAMRGSFPLNGTYFQVNEVFADDETSTNPSDVPRSLIWNLPRRTVFFGTSVSTIFKGMSTEDIQYCFWKGFVCVRGFDRETRAPRPLKARLHLAASKIAKRNE